VRSVAYVALFGRSAYFVAENSNLQVYVATHT
jgi:hypothetical protein